MKKFNLLCLGLLAGATLAGCSDDTLIPDNSQAEEYVRNFIERYGIPDPDHTFSMASRNYVTVKTSTPTDVEVTAEVGGTFYLFADWKGVEGTQKIDFDIPEGIEDVKIFANGYVYFAKLGSTVNLDAQPSQQVNSRGYNNFDIKDVNSSKITVLETESYTPNGIDYGFLKYKNGQIGTFYDNGAHQSRSMQHSLMAGLLKQVVAPEGDKNFYQNEEKFTNRPYSRSGWTDPVMFVHYLKKGLDLEVGILIGNQQTLEATNKLPKGKFYMMPMFKTGGYTNQMQKRVQNSSDFKDRGVRIEFYFETPSPSVFVENEGGTCNVRVEKTKGSFEEYNFDFGTNEDGSVKKGTESGFKTEVLNLYELFKGDDPATRILPIPLDAKDGINDYTPGKSVPPYVSYDADNVPVYNTDFEFWGPFNEYLQFKLDKLSETQKSNYYSDLLGIKEWLVARGYVCDGEDIPIVEQIYNPVTNEKINGAFSVLFPLAKKADAYEDIPSELQTNELYTRLPDDDDYTVYSSLIVSQYIPTGLAGNEFVYYFKLANGTIITTADAEHLYHYHYKYRLSTESEPYYSRGSIDPMALDFDGDGQPEIVYDDNTYVSGGGSKTSRHNWILACEDLGSTGDCDFNDVVISLKYASTNSNATQDEIKISPVAAGGTYPTYLMYNELTADGTTQVHFVGPEIHKWLGKDNFEETINTDDVDEIGLDNGMGITYNYPRAFHNGSSFTTTMVTVLADQTQNPDKNQSYAGFWVLVDKNDVLSSTGFITEEQEMKPVPAENEDAFWDIVGKSGANIIMNKASKSGGSAPMMMLLSSQWEWPKETLDIIQAYPLWKDWINDQDKSVHWYGINVEGKAPDEYHRENVTVRSDIQKLYDELENSAAE